MPKNRQKAKITAFKAPPASTTSNSHLASNKTTIQIEPGTILYDKDFNVCYEIEENKNLAFVKAKDEDGAWFRIKIYSTQTQKAMIENEAAAFKILAEAPCRRIVDLVRMFEVDKHTCFVFSIGASAKSLADVLQERTRHHLTLPEARHFGLQILQGVSHLHQQGVAHMNIHTGCLFFTGKFDIQIADFQMFEFKKSGVLKKAGRAAPWQAIDLWAMGQVMFAMLVGGTRDHLPTVRTVRDQNWLNGIKLPDSAVTLLHGLLDPNTASRFTAIKALENSFWKDGPCATEITTSIFRCPPGIPHGQKRFVTMMLGDEYLPEAKPFKRQRQTATMDETAVETEEKANE
ncbi:polo-like kinase 3 [Linnemannia schmuckeri]|uniref:Polo-like kinase 3 n=1 Tax=Linnemannia schmuckeri TaxID=64567 RepID=A0A9P5SAH5_9FUNG|nr:polo-like kinase 3 [Linnemannia schmuckeri]